MAMHKYEINGIKNCNYVSIFEPFVRYSKPISASDIAADTGLSLPTISRGLKSLQSKNIIVEDEREKSCAGRKTQLFALNKDYKHIVGILIEKTEIEIYVINLRGVILFKKVLQIKNCGVGKEILNEVCLCLEEFIANNYDPSSGRKSIEVIGIGSHGLINSEKGVVINAALIPGWTNLEIVKYFEDRFGINTFIDSTNHIFAMGYNNLKLNSSIIKNIVYFQIDIGLGAGVIIDNKLYQGSHNASGEIRNMIIWNPNIAGMYSYGYCPGNLSILEESFGTQKIYSEVYNYISQNPNSLLNEIINSSSDSKVEKSGMKMKYIDKTAQMGDEFCIRLLCEPVKIWSSIIINLICCYDPDVVVIGGDVCVETPYILSLIKQIVKNAFIPEIMIEGSNGDEFINWSIVNFALSHAYGLIKKEILENDTVS
jgi:predicted NBD/HSP70 family sugar kinase